MHERSSENTFKLLAWTTLLCQLPEKAVGTSSKRLKSQLRNAEVEKLGSKP